MWEQLNIFKRLTALEQKAKTMADQILALQTSLDAVVAELPTIVSAVASIQAQLSALQNSTTSTLSPADQAALAQATTDAATITTSLGNLNTSLAAPAAAAPAATPAP